MIKKKIKTVGVRAHAMARYVMHIKYETRES